MRKYMHILEFRYLNVFCKLIVYENFCALRNINICCNTAKIN